MVFSFVNRTFLIILMSTLLLSASYSNQAKAQIKVAAVVGNEAISTIDINERLKLAMFSSGLPQTDEVRRKLLPQIMQLLIDERLFNQEAKNLNINVSEAEIDAAMKNLEERNKIPAGQFVNFLKHNGINPATLREQLKAQLIKARIIAQKVRSTIVVTDAEVNERLESKSVVGDSYDEYNLSEIVVLVDKPSDEKKSHELALNISKQVKSGKNFADIAKQFSRSSSAENGGEIGWKSDQDLAPEAGSAIKSLAKNAVSEPIRSADGYYIYKINDKRTVESNGKDGASKEQKNKITELIAREKTELKVKKMMRDMRRKTFIEIKL